MIHLVNHLLLYIMRGPMTVDEAKKLLEKYPGFKMGD